MTDSNSYGRLPLRVTASPVLRTEPASRLGPIGRVPTGADDPHGFGAQLVDDVTQIIQRTAYVELAPARLWGPGLVSEFADAVDRLAVKVAKLQEAQGADR